MTSWLPGARALLDLPGLGRLGHVLAVSTDAPGWVSVYSSAAAPLPRALVRITVTAQAAIALTVSAVVLAP